MILGPKVLTPLFPIFSPQKIGVKKGKEEDRKYYAAIASSCSCSARYTVIIKLFLVVRR